MSVSSEVYARIGLIGNPSTVFDGKSIAIPFRNFSCRVEITGNEDHGIQFILPMDENRRFDSLSEFAHTIEVYGYYGAERLLLASLYGFNEYCRKNGWKLDCHNLCISYLSSIPRQVGLGGSSAIVTASLKALAIFYEIEIPDYELAQMSLSVENKQLGISAALIDRAVQIYDVPVLEDASINPPHIRKLGNISLPNLFVAYCDSLAGESGKTMHNNMRQRFEERDPKVIDTINRLAKCAEQGERAMCNGDNDEFGRLMDRNYQLRESIYTIPAAMKEIVEAGRRVGARVKFAGSGGAVVGTYEDNAMLYKLEEVYGNLDCRFIASVNWRPFQTRG